MDLLAAVNIDQEQLGVTKTKGFCEDRAGTGIPDIAYRLDKEAALSVTSFQIFPGKISFY